MQVITVKHTPANGTKATLTAATETGSTVLPYDYSMTLEDNVKSAVRDLLWELNGTTSGPQWHIGEMLSGDWVAVCALDEFAIYPA